MVRQMNKLYKPVELVRRQEQKDGHVEGDEAEITNGGVTFKELLELWYSMWLIY